ncbi:hypothetical protein S40285_08011 [Stachybotrys chlorohalonatus IBT 40285]|uniref:Rhodopsin domain-containing protein n=1 Tax=Stachybotrys chlorohalonatus (strain IBT 40285) TaxID=1283841 RepID=A0A084Q7M7_STAC4|nr:hypothetical protein S40285_08011 [Stachybotrys chlorohalonata IBT 40285]
MAAFPVVSRQQGAGDGPTESRADDVLIILITMQVFSTVVLLMRLCTRFAVQHLRLGADDWTIIVSWLFLVAYTVNVCMQTEYGLGRHLADLPPDTNHAASLELFFYGEALYYITVSMTKVSILCLYLKLFPQRTYRLFTWTMMGFVLGTGLGCTIAGIFQCDPIYRAWETQVPGTCFNQVALFLANAGLNILQDVIIYILPAPMLWKVQLPLKQRIALIFVFVVGGFVVVTGIIRLDSLRLASVSADPTWDNYGSAIWSSIEANFGVICASLVHFKPLIARFAPSMLGMSRSTKGSNMLRLGDEPSTGAKGSLQTFGARQGNKPFGILTEMELEDNVAQSQAELVSPSHGTATTTVSHNQESPFRDEADRPGVIHTTKHFSVSYKDAI